MHLLSSNRNIVNKGLVIIFLLFSTLTIKAQVTIGMNSKPSSAALLDLKTLDSTTGGITTKKGGLLLPRVALTALNALAPFIESGETTADRLANKGLLVYNLSNNTIFQPGIYIWNGSSWIPYVKGTDASATSGLTFANNSFFLGGALTQNTSITGTNTLTLGVPTTISNDLIVSGKETVQGQLSVAGTTTLNSTSIDVSSTGETLVIQDGKTGKAGKYLKAMDDTGRAEWQNIGTVSTTPPVSFGAGISYDPTNTIGKDTNTSIILPPGKWLVQCAFLFLVKEVSPVNNVSTPFYSHWVQIRMYNSATGALSTNSLVSGNVNKTAKYNMLTGYFVVTNSTSANITYTFKVTASSGEGYLWPAESLVDCFASTNKENTVVAFSLTE